MLSRAAHPSCVTEPLQLPAAPSHPMVSLVQCSEAQHDTGMDHGAAIEKVPECWKAGCGHASTGCPQCPRVPSTGSIPSRLIVFHRSFCGNETHGSMFEWSTAMQGASPLQAVSGCLPLPLQRKRVKCQLPSPYCIDPASASLMVPTCHRMEENRAI